MLVWLCTPIIAGVYGALHDQLSYTISPEYFTRFKYAQFRFEPWMFGGHRATVAVIGFLATWWVGAIIGVVLGLVCLRFSPAARMVRMAASGVAITLGVAMACALAGVIHAGFVSPSPRLYERAWSVGVLDLEAFHTVGTMHLFSYEGGGLGLLVALAYLFTRPARKGGPVPNWRLPGLRKLPDHRSKDRPSNRSM